MTVNRRMFAIKEAGDNYVAIFPTLAEAKEFLLRKVYKKFNTIVHSQPYMELESDKLKFNPDGTWTEFVHDMFKEIGEIHSNMGEFSIEEVDIKSHSIITWFGRNDIKESMNY